MKRYCIRRNPATGRWILYTGYDGRCYRIMGDCDSFPTAIKAVFA